MTRNDEAAAAYDGGYMAGRLDRGIGHRSEYSYFQESVNTPDSDDPVIRARYWRTVGYQDGNDGRERRRMP